MPFETNLQISSISCEQCGHKFTSDSSQSLSRCIAFTLTALVFYIPANTFPFLTMEMYGTRTSATIWSTVVSLSETGSWFIAIIIFLASILIPILKLIVLLYLSLTASQKSNRIFKTQLYHAIEYIGRWSMLDIFLLAVLVAIMKLGPWTSVQAEIGSLMFALVVIFTMIASSSFDPRLIWKRKNKI